MSSHPKEAFCLLYDETPSRSKSATKRRIVVGAARVKLLEERVPAEAGIGLVEWSWLVEYLATSGNAHLVGTQALVPRKDLYITDDDKVRFRRIVEEFWDAPWRGESR